MSVVNGYAWPVHPVQPYQYRLRLLNACDSRTLSLSAWVVDDGAVINSFEQLWAYQEIPIYVIGTEQGLLSGGPAKILSRDTDTVGSTVGSVTKYSNCGADEAKTFTEPNQGLLMQPGERYDAIIDFADQEGNKVYIINTGKLVCLKHT